MADEKIVRKPVASPTKAGIKRPRVVTGKMDEKKRRIAKKAVGAGGFGFQKQAGMMLDFSQDESHYQSGYQLEAYRTSYAYGLGGRSGTYDVPRYFVQMNEQNGGILYWPTTLKEKYSWYRYWARTDPYIGRALELLSDLPMSKLTLTMPKATKGLTKKKREEILRFFKYQMEVIGGFETCQSILWEWNMIGNVYMFHEWDEKRKMWSRAVMLPPEEVGVFEYPFQQNKRVEYRPERLIKLIEDGMPAEASDIPTGEECDHSDMQAKIIEGIPDELKEMVRREGCIVMDSDPMTGSFVHHIARRKSPYQDLGASVLERVLVPMLQKEHFKYTQLSLCSRNMTPKNLVTAPGLLREELDDLRTQIDLSYLDPEYTIVTNYEVTWEQIGAQDRLLNLDSEYERIDRQVFAALGVTRELLTGEGAFSGSKITVDILNTMFLLTREVLQNYIEKSLFIPICEAHGWYEEDENGIKDYWYPRVGFNRLTIRDNAEVFDSLFQLYQKGSLPVDIIYELFNLNSDEIDAKLLEDLFTVKDANFNRIVEEISGETGRALVENSDIVEKVAKYLSLDYQAPAGEEGGGGGEFGDFGDFGGGGGEEQPGGLSDEDVDAMADGIAEALPEGADDATIEEAVGGLDAGQPAEEPNQEG